MNTIDLINTLKTEIQNKLYPNIIPQNTQMPAGVYTVINSKDSQCTTTRQPYKQISRYQIDIYTKTYKEARQITTAIKNKLYPLAFDISSRDFFEKESGLFRQIIEFKIRN